MRWGFAMASKEIKVDEDLPNFFKSVKLSQADELILEQQNMRNNFLINLNDPDTIRRLDDTKVPKKAIQGTPWYQILSNPRYSHLFNYIGAFVNEREKLIEDGFAETSEAKFGEEEMAIRREQSDLIMILLNLASVPDSVITHPDMNFEPGWQHYFKLRVQNCREDFNKKLGSEIKFELYEQDGRKFYATEAPAGATLIPGKSHTLRYDRRVDFQNSELEERYQRFKDHRDKEL